MRPTQPGTCHIFATHCSVASSVIECALIISAVMRVGPERLDEFGLSLMPDVSLAPAAETK